MLLLARPAVALLLGNGHSTPAETATTGAALAMFALGLPGFCTYLYLVRVLQSMQRTRVAFYLYLVENGLNIVLALVLVHPLGVRGLALSLSIAYTVAACWPWPSSTSGSAAWPSRETWAPLWRVAIAARPDGRGRARRLQPLGRRPASPGCWPGSSAPCSPAASPSARCVIWLGRRHDRHRPAAAADRVDPSDPATPSDPVHPACEPAGRVRPASPPHRGTSASGGRSRRQPEQRTGPGAAHAAPPWQTPCMPGVHIVTDSACDLTDQLVKEHNVIVVPLTIRFGSEELEDRRQLTPAEFWERCRGKGDLPQTAAPSPGAFQAAFQQAADEGADAVLCLTISSKVSGTYGSAVTAADTFDGVPVRVLDTYSLTMGQGLLVIAAAEEAAAGAGIDELVAATEDRIPRTRIYGVLGGLEHLQRGGRIGGARALLGSLLNIKPVIQLKDGEVAEESKQRTRAKALAYMEAKVSADAPLERLAVADGACDDFERRPGPPDRHRHRAPAAPGRPRAGRRHPRRAQHGGRLLHRPPARTAGTAG